MRRNYKIGNPALWKNKGWNREEQIRDFLIRIQYELEHCGLVLSFVNNRHLLMVGYRQIDYHVLFSEIDNTVHIMSTDLNNLPRAEFPLTSSNLLYEIVSTINTHHYRWRHWYNHEKEEKLRLRVNWSKEGF